MNKRTISLLVVVIALVVAGIYTVARAQTGITIPPGKATFEAREKVLDATRNAVPTIAKTPLLISPYASCPRPTPSIMGIFIGAGHGPFGGRDIINNQAVVKSSAGFYYELWVGAPEEHPNQGLIRIVEDDPDPCASSAKGTAFPSMRDFIYPKGPITLTSIEGDIVVLSVPGGGIARFNVVTDQFLP